MLFSFNQGAEWNALTLQTAHINTLYCQWREEDRPRHRVCIPPSVRVSLRWPELFANIPQPPRFIRINTTLIFLGFFPPFFLPLGWERNKFKMVTSVIPTSTISSTSFVHIFSYYSNFFSSGGRVESYEYTKVFICSPTLDSFLIVVTLSTWQSFPILPHVLQLHSGPSVMLHLSTWLISFLVLRSLCCYNRHYWCSV